MLLHCLTVRETFLVAAKLRLPGSVSAKEKEEVVQAVVQELGLVKAADTKIGNACAERHWSFVAVSHARLHVGSIQLICLPHLLWHCLIAGLLLTDTGVLHTFATCVPSSVWHQSAVRAQHRRTEPQSCDALRFVRGVSGGERKRCNIGVEMMSNPRRALAMSSATAVTVGLLASSPSPSFACTTHRRRVISQVVAFGLLLTLTLTDGLDADFGLDAEAATYAHSLIFLDEPTSGLDAFQAQAVMQSLWSLASNGRTVVSTIHQPRCACLRVSKLLQARRRVLVVCMWSCSLACLLSLQSCLFA